MRNLSIIISGVFLVTALSMMSCSKEDTPAPPVDEEAFNLELTASETAVTIHSEITFEVTADGQKISDADIYIDDERIDGYQHTFDEVGTKMITAKKAGYKDSDPLEINVNEELSVDNDVYVLGSGYDVVSDGIAPLYWKNGEPVAFNHEAVFDMIFYSMAVADNEVYTVGERIYSSSRASAFYWKDDTYVELTDPNGYAKALDVAVANGDVYAAGLSGASYTSVAAVYWKNGELVSLSSADNSGNTLATAIDVVGNDVYVAGNVALDPVYWKNGAQSALDGSGIVESIAVSSDGDVYVAGHGLDDGITVAKYWKNSEAFVLGTGERESKAYDVFVENGAVYVAGYETILRPSGTGTVSVARYWKNGEAIDLTDGSYRAEATSIFVLDGDIYAAGVEFMGSGQKNFGTYWQNGETVRLSHEEDNG